MLEIGVLTVVVASAAAFGSVHPWSYVPMWWASAVLFTLTLAWFALRRHCRRAVGSPWFAFQKGGTRLYRSHSEAERALRGWSIDLERPLSVPLLLPGIAFVLWVLIQLVPRGSSAVSVSPPDTVRGLCFVLALLGIHLAAGAAFQPRSARRRLPWFLCIYGAALAFFGMVQSATGTKLIYWFFQPLEGGTAFFGPFTNRNHYAGYMLMIVPACASLFIDEVGRAVATIRPRRIGPALTRMAKSVTPRLALTTVATLATIGSLLAALSRGGMTAASLALGITALARRRRATAAGILLLALLAGTWYGTRRLEDRFVRTIEDVPGRTMAWRDALDRMGGRWITGWGLNTWSIAMSSSRPLTLPAGADAWPGDVQQSLAGGTWLGQRKLPGTSGFSWYREAHNDWLQLFVETGFPGLLIAIWALVAVVRSATWLPGLVGLLAVGLHSLVEFDFQIPAIPILFSVMASTLRGPSTVRRDE